MEHVLVVKTGTTRDVLTHRRDDFEDWIEAGLGVPVEVCRVDQGERLPPHDSAAGVVVTGSSAMVSHRLAWSERTAAWLAGAVDAEVPVLGICYGHQLLAHAVGGRVGPNPNGREIGTIEIHLTAAAAGDPLVSGLPKVASVQATHVESVLALPDGARLLAISALDPHHVFRVGSRPAWGVQFHPEFDAEITCGYLEGRREVLTTEGIDVDRVIATTHDTPWGEAVLGRFAEIAVGVPVQ